jgi:hypothetical protein
MMPETSPAALPQPAAAIGPRIYGVVDVLRPDRVGGWAIDRSDADAALEIDIQRDGALIATVRADRLRKDLEKGSVGSGRYGFACPLTPPLEPGFEFTVTVTARTADGVVAELRRPAAAAAGDPERRVIERIYGEVAQIRRHLQAGDDAADRQAEMLTRLETALARIEAAQSRLDAPAPPALLGLKLLVGLSLAVGGGSLVLGLWSMLQP